MKIKKRRTKRSRVDIGDDGDKIQGLKGRIDAKHQAIKMLIFENDFRFLSLRSELDRKKTNKEN